MPNFRIHQEKGHLLKKNKKRKLGEQTSSQKKKRRKLNKERKDKARAILDPKLFKEDLEKEGDTLMIDSSSKVKKVKKKKKKKKMSKKKKKKLESLRKKREEKLLFQKYCDTIKNNKVVDDEMFLKTAQVGKKLTSRQKVKRMANLIERNLDVPEELENEFSKLQNRKKDRFFSEEAQNELYYSRKKKEDEIVPPPPPPPPPSQVSFSQPSSIITPPPPPTSGVDEKLTESHSSLSDVKPNEMKQQQQEEEEEEESQKIDLIMDKVRKELNSENNLTEDENEEEEEEEEVENNNSTTFSLQFDFMNFTPKNNEEENKEELNSMDPQLQERIRRLGTYKENEDIQKYLLQEIEKQKKEIISKKKEEEGDEQKVMEPKKYFKLIDRDPDIESQRTMLPIIEKEQEIMELVLSNDVVIICGETGSGKTTQVPQFLFEGGFGFTQTGYPGMIGVTQPRRVAALSTSKRVSEEMGEKDIGGLVGVHIRYFKRFSPKKTKILYLTDGILLNEIQSDPLLLRYSVIILDEAHERNINTDILLGWCSRILPYRNEKAREGLRDPTGRPITPLKLLIMSATLKVSDFTENKRLFRKPPPVINVESRQFQVTVHFNRRTKSLGRGKESYVRESAEKVLKIHQKFPKGDILVFLTGRDEIQMLVQFLKEKDRDMRKRRKKYYQELRKLRNYHDEDEDDDDDGKKNGTNNNNNNNEEEEEEEEEEIEGFESFEDEEEWIRTKGEEMINPKDPMEKEEDEDEEEEVEEVFDNNGNSQQQQQQQQNTVILFQKKQQKQPEKVEDEEENTTTKDQNQKKKKKKKNIRRRPIFMKILPLHSNLQPKSQLEVFNPTPANTRKIVVATNVAETSITISGIRYVIDCGKAKYKHHFVNPSDHKGDTLPSAPIIQYRIQWCSKSSALQRSGRSGRTCPGHCYRLYSAPVFQQFFPDYEIPELLRAPMDTVVLRMKCLGMDYIQNFPFPSPPKSKLIRQAVRSLIHIKALRPLTLSERLSINNIGDNEIFEDSEFLTRVTKLGKKLNRYPLHPRLSKMLLFGLGLSQKVGGAGLGQFVVLLVAVMSSTYPILMNSIPSKKVRSKWFGGRKSDVIALFCLSGGCLYYPINSQAQIGFCEEYGVSVRSIKEISKLRIQLDLLLKKVEGLGPTYNFCPSQMPPPNETTRLFLRQVICCGFADQSAVLVDNEGEIRRLMGNEKYLMLKKNKRKSIRPIYITHALGDDTPVFIHPTSFFSEYPSPPRVVCYKELVRTKGNEICMCGVTIVKQDWIKKYGNLDWEKQQ